MSNSDLNQKNATPEGTLFVISGPSGAGKSSLIKKAMSKLDNFVKSVSVTTRPIRSGEIQDKNYHFLNYY